MTYLQGLFLGILQGLTEFLPVSSSGHLALGRHLLGLDLPGITFEVLLHAGTLVSVLAVFGGDVSRIAMAVVRGLGGGDGAFWANPYRRMAFWVLAGSLVTAGMALALEDKAREFFLRPEMVGVFWLVTGLVLLSTRYLARTQGHAFREMSLPVALWVGLCQGLAILPGISRSGITIAGGMWGGLDRQTAARFSFLLAVPAIFGAALYDLWDALGSGQAYHLSGPFLVGFVAAALSGYVAIRILLKVLERGDLAGFGYYCWAIGISAIILGLI